MRVEVHDVHEVVDKVGREPVVAQPFAELVHKYVRAHGVERSSFFAVVVSRVA